MNDLTQILERVEKGDGNAAAELLPLVYEELRKLAAARMAQEAAGNTLQPTALVHEAWLRLVGNQNQQWAGRSHFFGAAAEAMRRILIERARRKAAQRHGGGQQRVDLEAVEVSAPTLDDTQLLAVHEALDKLAKQNRLQAEVVKLRYFVGMSVEETAHAMDISVRSAEYYWAHARAWLYQEIRPAKSE